MPDPFDVCLEDHELLHEVELTTTLIMAANECDEPLDQQLIDSLLGVEPLSSPTSSLQR